jgi:hypothetical protein
MARRAETGDAPQAPRREADLAARWASGAARRYGRRLARAFGSSSRGGATAAPAPIFATQCSKRSRARGCSATSNCICARDWLAHGHHTDTRYNRVILHVALDGASVSSPLASGKVAPVVSLSFTSTTTLAPMQPGWPCEGLRARVGEVALRATLLWAGLERFEQRVSAFGTAMIEVEDISSMPELPWTAADRILWVALAEALGYGRNRAALRQAGIQFLTGDPPDVMAARRGERARLYGLLTLWERWSAMGPWAPLREALELRASAVVDALRAPGGAISPARARIMATRRSSISPKSAISNCPDCRRIRSPARWASSLASWRRQPGRGRSRGCITSGLAGVTRRHAGAAPAIHTLRRRHPFPATSPLSPYRQSRADTV